MNFSAVEPVANAVLYEGYLLYPYRPSSVKNQQRWNFGTVSAPAWCAARGGPEISRMQTECLVRGGPETVLDIKARFLQMSTRGPHGPAAQAWQEATERVVISGECELGDLLDRSRRRLFTFADERPSDDRMEPTGYAVNGHLEVGAIEKRPGVYRVKTEIVNRTPWVPDDTSTHEDALLRSLVSAHTLLGVSGGRFVSLVDPPDDLRDEVSTCRNVGTWPVLVGDPERSDMLLSSPIILYDYPQVAAESAGDLFDATEIDEILTLRILTMTDEEKREMRETDERARQMLERTESLPAEALARLHGAVRGLRRLSPEGT